MYLYNKVDKTKCENWLEHLFNIDNKNNSMKNEKS